MKDSKSSRKRVDWLVVLAQVLDEEKRNYFNDLFSRDYDGKRMSINRCAYNTLKHFYSTTTIDELCEKVGIL